MLHRHVKSFFMFMDHTCLWDGTCKTFGFIYRHWAFLKSGAASLWGCVVLRLLETFIVSCLGGAVHAHEWYPGYDNAAEQGDWGDDHLPTVQKDIRPLLQSLLDNLGRIV